MSKPALADSPSASLLRKVCGVLQEQMKDKPTSPLLPLIVNFQQKSVKQEEEEPMEVEVTKPSTPTKRVAGGKGGRKGRTDDSDENLAYAALRSSSAHPSAFERQINHLVDEALKKKSTRPLVNAMSKMLLEEENLAKAEGNSSEAKKAKVAKDGKGGGAAAAAALRNRVKTKAGLLVDWLESLDPELVQTSPELQQKLLFSRCLLKMPGSGARRERSCQPYLLTMLTHQASWASLRKTVDCVLKAYNPSFDAAAVLDFLSACVDVPKLWYGRAKHQPKHETLQDVLALDVKQLLVVADYQLLEAAEVADSAPKASADVLKTRIPLLIRCLGNDRHKTRAVVDYLVEKITDHEEDDVEEDNDKRKKKKDDVPNINNNRKDVVQELLLQVYMKLPNCLIHMTCDSTSYENLLPSAVTSFGNTSVVDCISHTILSALAATQHGRNWVRGGCCDFCSC